MHATMVNLSVGTQKIIDLGEVYKHVRIDNPMAAYTKGINWRAAPYPGLIFGEPVCNSSLECPDATDEGVDLFADCDKWDEYHTHRDVVTFISP